MIFFSSCLISKLKLLISTSTNFGLRPDCTIGHNEVDQHTTSFFSEVVQLVGKGPANSGTGVSHFNPPLDSLNKLKFKIRHHDYSLVDFKNRDFTIVLQIVTLEPDPFKVGRLRKPEFYEH